MKYNEYVPHKILAGTVKLEDLYGNKIYLNEEPKS